MVATQQKTFAPRMLKQLKILTLATLCSWYGMMTFHEAGHVIVAWANGADIEKISVPLVGFSHTVVENDPNPLWTAWAGALGGDAFALLLLLATWHFPRTGRHIALYFAGFSLNANGLYLGVGVLYRAGDSGDLLRLGAEPWHLALFGLVSVCSGCYCWHRMGEVRDLFLPDEGR